jgi:HPt (histidine-containing phosphotransfer) domain-containing protein
MIKHLCHGNMEKVNKMVSVFIEQIPQAVEEIKSAYDIRDFMTIKKVAHKIKPTLSYYAVVKVEKDIQLIEKMAENELVSVELELMILKLDEVVNLTVEKMKEDFSQY